MADPLLLNLLRCPVTLQKLSTASDTQITQINQSIRSGTCKTRSGLTVATQIDAGLVREDGAFLYPVRNDIPVMLADEAIPLSR